MVRYKGGYVKEPKIGIHKNIIVLDFRNLLPSIIITHNIDITTFCKKCKKKVFVPGFKDRWFCQDKRAEIPKRLEKILKERWELKKKIKKLKGKEKEKTIKKAYQLKLAANITYGKFGYPKSSHYNVKIAESITAFGRYYIKYVINQAEKNGLNVIYADTDSVFLTNSTIKNAKEFLKKINKSLPGIMKLEYRGFYKKGLFVSKKGGKGAKKKYALIDNKGNILIRGFETRREDWCNLAKTTQEHVLKLVLEDKIKDAVEYVKQLSEK